MNLVPNMSAKSYSSSAFIIGILLSEGMTPAEQNSLGNWFMLLAQALCTTSAQQQVLNNRNNHTTNSNKQTVYDNNLKESSNNIKKELNKIFNSFK